MSKDIQRGQNPPRRDEPGREEGHGPDSDFGPARPYPATAIAAGIIWIVFGSLILLNLLNAFGISLRPIEASREEAHDAVSAFIFAANTRRTTGILCGTVFMGLIRGAVLFVGIRTIWGAARDTLGSGVRSILLGGLIGVAGYTQLGVMDSFNASVACLEAAALMLAGVLALVGQRAYKDWRRAKKGRGEGGFRREASEEEYGLDSDFRAPPPYPPTVFAGGVISIVFGCLVLLFALFLVFPSWGLCGTVFIGLLGGTVLFVGIQTIRGKARDTLGNGVGSIVLGGLIGVGAAFLLYEYFSLGPGVVGVAPLAEGGVLALGAATLVEAGILTLRGRRQYKLWRMAQKSRRDQ